MDGRLVVASHVARSRPRRRGIAPSRVGFSRLRWRVMAQEKPNPFAEWLQVVRTQAPVARARAAAWFAAAREEPALIWRTPAVRYGAYGLAAAVLLVSVQAGMGMFTTPLPADAGAGATSADFHVVCSSNSCRHHFVIHRDFGFDDFPVECARCKKATGLSARRCYSSTCHGRWMAPQRRGTVEACPHCGAEFP